VIRKILPYILVVFLVLWTGGAAFFIGHILSLKPPPATLHTDAIVVLTGGSKRINTGFDLMRDNTANKMLITGVDSRVTIEKLTSLWNPGEGAPCCVTLDHDARNTRENALMAAKWANETNNIKSIRLITTDYHIPRAMVEFHYALPGVALYPHPVASHNKIFWPLVLQEYNKTLIAWFWLWLTK